MTNTLAPLALALFSLGLSLSPAAAQSPKPFHTQKVKDVVITLESPTSGFAAGKNAFVLAFASASTKAPVDAGKVTLNTTMPMPGMAPMIAGASLTPDGTGRYRGT